MSKAFVKEDAAEAEAAPERAPAAPGGKNYITPEGFARLKGELKHLVEVERPEVVRTVAWAASNGDRSENGDYIYGKRRLREIDRRMRHLAHRIDIAEPVDPTRQAARDRVFFGARVTYRDASGERRVRIVGVDETELEDGAISWISPVARALMRARVGDAVEVRAPEGAITLTVLAIEYPD